LANFINNYTSNPNFLFHNIFSKLHSIHDNGTRKQVSENFCHKRVRTVYGKNVAMCTSLTVAQTLGTTPVSSNCRHANKSLWSFFTTTVKILFY